MGLSHSQPKRVIQLKNPEKRLNKEEHERLKSAFQAIQGFNVITRQQFKSDIIGKQMPDRLADKLFNTFRSNDKKMSKDQICFDDLIHMYATFRYATPQEKAWLVFEVLLDKSNEDRNLEPGHKDENQDLPPGFLEKYIKEIMGGTDEELSKFITESNLDASQQTTRQDFAQEFEKVMDMPFFTWIYQIFDGYQKPTKNVDPKIDMERQIERRLTHIKEQRQKNYCSNMGFIDEEPNFIFEYFQKKIVEQSAYPAQIKKTLDKLFKDVKSIQLKQLFLKAIIKKKEYNFQNFITIVFNIARVNEDKTQLIFLANLLADNLDDGTHLLQQDPEQVFEQEQQRSERKKEIFLTSKMLQDFISIFNLDSSFEKSIQKTGGKVKRDDFVREALKIVQKIDFSIYKDARLMLIGSLSMACQDAEEQKQAILKLLDGNTNIQGYIYQNLENQSTYYLVNSDFWTQWTANVGFYSEQATFSFDVKPLENINNDKFIEEKHQERLKEMEFETDFIVLPEDVFWSLSKWYPANRYIERRTLQFHQKKLNVKQIKNDNEEMSQSQKKKETIEKQVFNFKKYYADIVYELEVFPRFIYFQLITQDGEKPHLSAILNKRIDPVYIEKECKNQNIPFGERYFSRRTTLKSLLTLLTDQLKQSSGIPNNPEDDERPYKGLKAQMARIWNGEELIEKQYMDKTLEEYGISDGSFIYLEYMTSTNSWPTEKKQKQKMRLIEDKKKTDKRGLNIKSVGLKNLGNTCYMNSALQCLANTKFFKDYFASKAKYFLQDINEDAVLGYNGDLAESFGGLMIEMWNSKKNDIAPAQFKTKLDAVSQQFEGFEQHDSQEFLAFMVDGLHEDLNLVLKKPFVEEPESEGHDLWRLSLHCYANNLRREYSFIQFMFSGQLLSTMTCQHCFNRSYKFENFSSISLPLPEPKMKLITIIIQRLPSEIKDTLAKKGTRLMQRMQVVKDRYNKKSQSNEDEDKNQLSRSVMLEEEQKHQQISEGQEKGPMRMEDLQNSDNQHLGDESFQECFANEFDSLKNDHPLKLTFQVDVEATIAEIIEQICQMKEVNIDPQLKSTKVVFMLAQNVPGHCNLNFSQQQSYIKGILGSQRKLAQIKGLDEDIILASEVLTQEGRVAMARYYSEENQSYLLSNENALLQNVVDKKIRENQFNMLYAMNERRKTLYKRANNFPRIDQYQSFNKQQQLIQYWESNYLKFPDYIYVVALHRRYMKKKVYFFNPDFYQIFGLPLLLELPLQPSGIEVYQEIWSIAQNVLKLKSSFKNRKNLWWEQENAEQLVEEASKVCSEVELKPFVLKSVQRNSMSCFNCSFEDNCNGCILVPGEAAMEDFIARGTIIIEWHSSLIEEDYNTGSNQIVEHQPKLVEENYQMHLKDCFELFSREEKLDEMSGINCTKCKQIQPMYKKMDIYRPPPMLVIQLKRFKERNGTYVKIQSPVDFEPQLSLRDFIYDESRLQDLKISENYNLYALINHYGTLTFGHYMSVLRHQPVGKQTEWYCYDDNKAYKLNEQQMKDKVSCYILFYIRKDVEEMNYFTEVFPALKTSIFKGKPVKLRENNKDGVILDWAEEIKSNENEGPISENHVDEEQIRVEQKEKSKEKVLVFIPETKQVKTLHKFKELIHDTNDPDYTEEELKEDLKQKKEDQIRINEVEEQLLRVQMEKEALEKKKEEERLRQEAIQKARQRALEEEVERTRKEQLAKEEKEKKEKDQQKKLEEEQQETEEIGEPQLEQDDDEDFDDARVPEEEASINKTEIKTQKSQIEDKDLPDKVKIKEEEPTKEEKAEETKLTKEEKEKDDEIARLKAELQKAKSETHNPEKRTRRKRSKKKKNACCVKLKKMARGKRNDVCVIF